ncbi:MAG: 23S rRNA (adenine(2503)-C(2))-methyltransferase RlmN, partial [Sporomusaceae bacterium]|nr:23S rRNA (adenine(2503)-C(2))-methyltransferase RlmN [Sporomusaceae bacterium]
MKQNLFGLSIQAISEAVGAYGLKPFRGRQIAKAIYQRFVTDFSEMTDLSKEDRALLSEHFSIEAPQLEREIVSKDQKTCKVLLQLIDGACVETVLMRQPYGNSLCISTQVGCAMGCLFCASTLKGLERDLTVGEIIGQIWFMQRLLAKTEEKVDTVVVMGTGEPLQNYDSLLAAIRLCHDKDV